MRGIESELADVKNLNRLFPTVEENARRDGVDLPGAEHLLLAALELPEGAGVRALQRIELTPHDLADAIAAVPSDCVRAVGADAEIAGDHLPPLLPSATLFRMQEPADEMLRRVTSEVRQQDSELTGALFLPDAAENARARPGPAWCRSVGICHGRPGRAVAPGGGK